MTVAWAAKANEVVLVRAPDGLTWRGAVVLCTGAISVRVRHADETEADVSASDVMACEHDWEVRNEYVDAATTRYRCAICHAWGHRQWGGGRKPRPIRAYAGLISEHEADRRWAQRRHAWVGPAWSGIRRGHGPDV